MVICKHYKRKSECNICKAMEQVKTNPVLNAIIRRIEGQTAKGIEKYGHTVEPSKLSMVEWIEHAQQELVDMQIYLECVKQSILRGEGFGQAKTEEGNEKAT